MLADMMIQDDTNFHSRMLMGSLSAVLLWNSGFAAHVLRSITYHRTFSCRIYAVYITVRHNDIGTKFYKLGHPLTRLHANVSCEAIRYVLYIMTECAHLGRE